MSLFTESKKKKSAEAGSKKIRFPNGNEACLVSAKVGADAEDILEALDIAQPGGIIIILGGMQEFDDPALKARLVQLFSRGIAISAAATNAMILGSGVSSGASAMMGQGVADRGRKSHLVGVAPSGKVSYPGTAGENGGEKRVPLNENHSHFVLLDGEEWDAAAGTLFEIAKARGSGIPVTTLVVNGDETALTGVLHSVRQGWPVIVIQGSGGSADEISEHLKKKSALIEDPVMAEIIANGDIHIFPVENSVENLERLIVRELGGNASLRLAWENFALYDSNSGQYQRSFLTMQNRILILAVIGTFLALTQTQFNLWGAAPPADLAWLERFKEDSLIDLVFKYIIIIIPITVSVILAAANRFKAGHKWVLLRSSTEAIKQQIYRYRTQSGIFSDENTRKESREVKLARRLKAITKQLMQTEVNVAGFEPYKGPIPPPYGAAPNDKGMGFLTPDQYIKFRLEDQLNYYRRKVEQMEKKSRRYQWYIYLAGGLGTLLAALGFELWIALTTAVAGALTTFLEFRQLESTVMNYNQAATDLDNIKSWWVALSAEDQTKSQNRDKLVDYTENTLQREYSGWVQQMQDMLDTLQEEQKKELEDEQQKG